jgi:uncharacterized protein YndB with AHSA1/START domain/uncharacterized protein YciI
MVNGDDMPQKSQFLAQLHGTRKGWPENMTPAEERIMDEHFEYLKKLTAETKVLMAGPAFGAFGLIVLQTESEEEANDIMRIEPSVARGVHTYELYPMRVSLMAEHTPLDRYEREPSNSILQKEEIVAANLDQVWHAWTTTEGVKSFFSPEANVELRISGPYEIYFNMEAPYGQRGSEDCHILSYLPKRMLSFEWNAPPQFGELRNKRTQVILMFDPIDDKRVKVSLFQTGWGRGEEWQKLFEYFDSAWGRVLKNFKASFESHD